MVANNIHGKYGDKIIRNGKVAFVRNIDQYHRRACLGVVHQVDRIDPRVVQECKRRVPLSVLHRVDDAP